MSLLKKLQKLASSSAALRAAHLQKEAGFGTALMGMGKSIASGTVRAASKHFAGQVAKHGVIPAVVGTGLGAMTLAAAPGAAVKAYKANKAGFNPALHKTEMEMGIK